MSVRNTVSSTHPTHLHRKFRFEKSSFIINKYVDKDEILQIAIKLYHYKKKQWVITGYKCPYCNKNYQTLRNELYVHIDNCEGTRKKSSEYED